MKRKCTVCKIFTVTLAVIFAVTFGTGNTLAALLDNNSLTGQEKLGDLLTPNQTDNEQTVQQGTDQAGKVIQEGTPDTTKSEVTTQQKAGPIIQDIKESALVDRIFPKIVEKLDGATILNKVDGKQLLEKLDGQQLLVKVLPYLSVSARSYEVPGKAIRFSKPSLVTSEVGCPEGTALVGGGFQIGEKYKESGADDFHLREFKQSFLPTNNWHIEIEHGAGGVQTPWAQCLLISVGVKQ
jgi:hypothetical protein